MSFHLLTRVAMVELEHHLVANAALGAGACIQQIEDVSPISRTDPLVA